MSIEANKALVRRLYEESDKLNFDVLDEVFSPDFVDRSPPPIPGLAKGLPGLKQIVKAFIAATPDGKHEIHHMIAEDDLVAVHLTARGTHTGSLLGAPPTGKTLEMKSIVIYRIAGGKIVERWLQHDASGMPRMQH